MAKYVIGVDFGTLSSRAVVVEVGSGRELSGATMNYKHGVMDEYLPTGERLKPDWALQHPQDYLDCISYNIPEAMRLAGIDSADVIGVGIDFTANTVIPVDAEGMPLCLKPEWEHNPHAWVKLWKHHGAQAEANRMTAIAEERGETFLARYGGKVSSEWMMPKLWNLLNEAPEVYKAADRFMEAGDWVIMQLTGNATANACMAGYKWFWSKAEGYPSDDFFAALDPRMEHVVDEKLTRDILPIGAKAGEITEEAAKFTGLKPGTAVAVATIDAHVSIPATGSVEAGNMLMIMGTSTCDIMVSDEEHIVPGMCGVVEDGVVPGLLGYEAGQSCVGDHFNWFVDNCVPAHYAEEAKEKGMDLHQLLTEKAAQLKPGESGLIALDWWNGNRALPCQKGLSGTIIGMDLSTKPEHIFRALVEATAFGARKITDNFRKYGLDINIIHAAGGIAEKNPFVMQLYADVLDIDIKISASPQAAALGAAIFGAVAGGAYDSVTEAANHMGKLKDIVYKPDPGNRAVYDALYEEFCRLYDYFGRENDTMNKIKLYK